MKKPLRYFAAAALAAVAAVFAALGLAACGRGKLESLSIENARTEFTVGDEFEYGEGFAVYAVYSDGGKKDVTESAEIRKESDFDMEVEGNYQITVGYGGLKEVYTIYVHGFDNILRKVELEVPDGVKSYKVGDELSLAGIKANLTYENAQGIQFNVTTADLKDFAITVTDKNGDDCGRTFMRLGEYTVTFARSGVKASYTVSVDGVNISTVRGALTVGTAFRTEVTGGTQTLRESVLGKDYVMSFSHDYTFGDNYTYVKETEYSASFGNTVRETYCGIYDKELFCIYKVDGDMQPNDFADVNMMNGAKHLLYFVRYTGYGIEDALNYIYDHALQASNKDLKETADEGKRTYSFTFSGLEQYSNKYDYYEQTVVFTLGEKYNVEHVEIEQKIWENNLDNPSVEHSFATDANGFTAPSGNYSYSVKIVADQTAGTRTAKNPYSPDMFAISSYNLKRSSVINDGDVIKCKVGDVINILATDFQPKDASFQYDPLFVDYEGNHTGYTDATVGLYCEAFYLTRSGNMITISVTEGGVWEIYLKTQNTLKTVILDITGKAPTEMTAKIRNDGTGNFYAASAASVSVNGAVHFKGEVNKYANAAQTAQITSANASAATLEKVTLGGVECFKFTASAEGTYTVKVTSSASASVSVTFTFTVSAAPDYAQLLTGKYYVTDALGDIYEITFTPVNSGGGINGTVAVTQTPTAADGTPLTAQAKTQTLSYAVADSGLALTVTAVSGDNLGVDFKADSSGNLVLEDRYGDGYILSRTE